MCRLPRDNPVRLLGTYYDLFLVSGREYQRDCDVLEAIFHMHAEAGPRRILDLGCGTAEYVLILSRGGYQLTGIDHSAAMLAEARKKLRQAGVRADLHLRDMRDFPARRFAVAICMKSTVGYLLTDDDALAALARVARCLRPSGLFVFEFWNTFVPPQRSSWRKRVHGARRLWVWKRTGSCSASGLRSGSNRGFG